MVNDQHELVWNYHLLIKCHEKLDLHQLLFELTMQMDGRLNESIFMILGNEKIWTLYVWGFLRRFEI
jgi:hypothetical protein